MLIQVLLLIHIFCISLNNSLPQVQVSDGLIQGKVQTTRKGRKISAFLGIPYAEPPVGELRFSNPVPVKPWKDVLQAINDGNQCPQLFGIRVVGNEDCLFLNVYTPIQQFNSSMSLLPVMVWIHGGAFTSGNGSSTTYGPEFLLDKEIIYVSINYRLGIFGFLSTGDKIAPGNFGLKDQVLALKWVQKNIKAFGGDPKKVTIFGQSAGGVSVGLHALSDASNGLFHQYIIQSGSVLVPWGYQNRSQYKLYSRAIALLHICPIFNSKTIINCLRHRDYRQLLSTAAVFNIFARFAQLTFTPTDEPESEDAFLTDSPENLISKKKMKDLAFITGNVANEGEIISQVLYSNELVYNTIRALVNNFIDYVVRSYLKSEDVHKFRNEVINFYFGGSISYNKDKFIQSLSNFLNDAFFLYPEVKLLEKTAKTAKSPFYFYILNYQGNIIQSFKKGINSTGVGHSEDLFYLFPLKFERLESKGSDERTVDLILDLWTSFASNGEPKSEQLRNPNLWLKYTDDKNYLYISGDSNNLSVTLENQFMIDRINFWNNRDSRP